MNENAPPLLRSLLIALTLAVCTLARAAPPTTQTQTHTLSIGPVGFESRTFNVPQFDTSQGTLVSVDVSGNVHDATDYAFELHCSGMPGSGSIDENNRNWVELTYGTHTVAAGSGGEVVTLTALNDGGSASLSSSFEEPLSIPSISGTAARPFAGTGTLPVVLDLHRTQYYSNLTGCAVGQGFPIAVGNTYTYTLTVAYTFQ